MQTNNKKKITKEIKATEADIKHFSNKTTTVSKKKLTVGIICASFLIAGLGGVAGYFGYKAMNNNGNTSSEVIVDPASKSDVTISKFETVDGGDKLGTVTSTTKEIINVKVSIGSVVLSGSEYKANESNHNGESKWTIRIYKATLSKYTGTIVVAPVFDVTPTPTEKFTVKFETDGGSIVAD